MKQQYEEKIDSFLEQLAREFPRLEILDDVFPSTKIQTLVASIYQEGIRFARECTVYYSRSSAGLLHRSNLALKDRTNSKGQDESDMLQNPH